jgi:serine-type D-Ala-D-Ala carboxypeptidase/endopeptidase (penicillin-binding protein 4)
MPTCWKPVACVVAAGFITSAAMLPVHASESLTPNARQASRTAVSAAQPASRAELAADLDAVFDDPKYSCAFWGVRVERLEDGQVVYDRLGHKQFTPASNMKVFTTAAALELLGPEFTYETRVEAVGTIEADGTLRGDLLIVGSGDPSLGAWHPDKERDSRQVLADWTAEIKAAGIRRVSGDVVGDGRCFAETSYSSYWSYGDLHFWYAAGVSGLAIEENAYRVVIRPGPKVGDAALLEVTPKTSYITIINETRTVEAGGPSTADSVPHQTEGNARRFVGPIAIDKTQINERGSVWDGAHYAAHLFAEELERQGIAVQGRPVNIRMSANADRIDSAEAGRRQVLATTVSPPLKDLIKVVNKPSHNFFADQILCTLGRQRFGTGDFATGAKAVSAWLEQIGVPEHQTFQMRDGSGLARGNAFQPRQICHVLRHMRQSEKVADSFVESLPIADVDGTLSQRLKHSSTRGNVKAKTGYIGNVRCLSGYITDADGNELVFSMMCNQYQVPTREVNASQDEACRIIAQRKGLFSRAAQ